MAVVRCPSIKRTARTAYHVRRRPHLGNVLTVNGCEVIFVVFVFLATDGEGSISAIQIEYERIFDEIIVGVNNSGTVGLDYRVRSMGEFLTGDIYSTVHGDRLANSAGSDTRTMIDMALLVRGVVVHLLQVNDGVVGLAGFPLGIDRLIAVELGLGRGGRSVLRIGIPTRKGIAGTGGRGIVGILGIAVGSMGVYGFAAG